VAPVDEAHWTHICKLAGIPARLKRANKAA
jgi:hypothetical protein